MLYVVVTLVTLLLVFAMMAIGLIVRNKPIKGTCASLSNIGMKENCEICGGDEDKCESNKPASGNLVGENLVSEKRVPPIFKEAGRRN